MIGKCIHLNKLKKIFLIEFTTVVVMTTCWLAGSSFLFVSSGGWRHSMTMKKWKCITLCCDAEKNESLVSALKTFPSRHKGNLEWCFPWLQFLISVTPSRMSPQYRKYWKLNEFEKFQNLKFNKGQVVRMIAEAIFLITRLHY